MKAAIHSAFATRRSILAKAVLIIPLASILQISATQAQWVAVNDHASGPGTHPNATRYHIMGLENGTSGPLRNLATGEALPITLSMTRSLPAFTQPELSGADPGSGTPLAAAFDGLADFSQTNIAENVRLIISAAVTYTLSNLTPGQLYLIQGGAVSSSAASNVYTMFTLQGAETFSSHHSAGALTSADYPASIQTNQVAINISASDDPNGGDMFEWIVTPGTSGTISIVANRYTGAIPDGTPASFAYAPTALKISEVVPSAPTIVVQPKARFALVDETAVFSIQATGFPLAYQWWRDGVVMSGAISSVLVLPDLQRADSGSSLWVVVSDGMTSVTSSMARLIVTAPLTPFVSFSDVWRYEVSDTDLGEAWRELDYDDSQWAEGPGPVGIENANLPVPLGTSLFGDVPFTAYFRRAFFLSEEMPVGMYFTNMIDDGAVFYLNGQEIFRVGMPSGPVTFNTGAIRGVGNAVLESVIMPFDSFRRGANVLAVEVHQPSLGSSDFVMGVRMDAAERVPSFLVITNQPQDKIADLAEPVTFEVGVEGSPVTYQWFKDGIPISGADMSLHEIPDVMPEDAGNYSVRVTNIVNEVMSRNAVLTVLAERAPTVEEHPVGGLYFGGASVTLQAEVSGTSPLFLQWFRDGMPVLNSTNEFFTIANLSPDTAGDYSLQVSNVLGVAVSDPARIELVNNMLNLLAFNHEWRYRADGVNLGTAWRPPTYDDGDWPSGHGALGRTPQSTPIPLNTVLPLTNATGSPIITRYFRARFAVPSHQGILDLVLTNWIKDGAVFYLDGEELYRVRLGEPGSTVNYATLASSAKPSNPALEFVHSPGLTLTPGIHDLAVEVHQVSTLSADAYLGTQLWLLPGAGEPLQIIDHPQSVTVPQGTPVELSVNVFGGLPITFQWYKDDSPLMGENQRSLSIQSYSSLVSGTYHVEVGNALGSLESEPATLSIDTNSYVMPVVARGPYLQGVTGTNVILRWQTDIPTPTEVRLGLDPEDLHQTVTDTNLVQHHAVTLGDLLPGTQYHYAIHVPGTNLTAGPDYYFSTLNDEPGPVRIWVLGDSGRANDDAAAVANAYRALAAEEREADVWLMLGDNAYNSGTDHEYQRAVFEMYPDLLRKMGLWSTIGNHETFSADINGHYAYFDIFDPPTQGEAGGVASGVENYYSFDYANIHFVCLDSEDSDLSGDAPMADWLRADLEAHTADWLIAFWHSPPYTRGTYDSDNILGIEGRLVAMRENFLPILEAHGVDLVLCGHSHVYERSHLLDGHYGYSNTLVPAMIKDGGSGRPEETGAYLKPSASGGWGEGAVYVVAGNGSQTMNFYGLDHPVMFVGLAALGSLIVDIDGSRLEARFLRETGEIDDHFTILKGVPAAPFRVVQATRREGELHFSWKSQASRSYRLWSTPDLEMPVWTPLSHWIMATGATTFYSQPEDAGVDRLFFVVEEEAP